MTKSEGEMLCQIPLSDSFLRRKNGLLWTIFSQVYVHCTKCTVCRGSTPQINRNASTSWTSTKILIKRIFCMPKIFLGLIFDESNILSLIVV
jgi:hypothetical protein